MRELARQGLEQEHRGLGVPGDGRDLNDLPMDDADVILEMDGTRKPGCSFFAKSIELGNTNGIEFTNAALVHQAREVATNRVTQNRGAIVLAEGRALFVGTPPWISLEPGNGRGWCFRNRNRNQPELPQTGNYNHKSKHRNCTQKREVHAPCWSTGQEGRIGSPLGRLAEGGQA